MTNSSDLLPDIVAYISEKLNLNGNSYDRVCQIKNKYNIREILSKINLFENIRYAKYIGNEPDFYPCVIKPVQGSAKKGVFYVSGRDAFAKLIDRIQGFTNEIMLEEYIEGREISVECISYKNKHYILQITDKESAGAPNFVELSHHQPADISLQLKNKLYKIIPEFLNELGYSNGATHIELKIDNNDKIYLIEINLRGGGDEISSQLVKLSTGYDYIKGMIEVALDIFTPPPYYKRLLLLGYIFYANKLKIGWIFFLQI